MSSVRLDDFASRDEDEAKYHIYASGLNRVVRYVKPQQRQEISSDSPVKYQRKSYINILEKKNFAQSGRFSALRCLLNPRKAINPIDSNGYGSFKVVIIGLTRYPSEAISDTEGKNDLMYPKSPYLKFSIDGRDICKTSVLTDEFFQKNENGSENAFIDERVEFQVHDPYSELEINLCDFDGTKGAYEKYDDDYGSLNFESRSFIPGEYYDITVRFPFIDDCEYPYNGNSNSNLLVLETPNSPFYNTESNENGKKVIYYKKFAASIDDILTENRSCFYLKRCDLTPKNDYDTEYNNLIPNFDPIVCKSQKFCCTLRIIVCFEIESLTGELAVHTLPQIARDRVVDQLDYKKLWEDINILKHLYWDRLFCRIFGLISKVKNWQNTLISTIAVLFWVLCFWRPYQILPILLLSMDMSISEFIINKRIEIRRNFVDQNLKNNGSESPQKENLFRSIITSAMSRETKINFARLHIRIVNAINCFEAFCQFLRTHKRDIRVFLLLLGILCFFFPNHAYEATKLIIFCIGLFLMTRDFFIVNFVMRVFTGLFMFVKVNQKRKSRNLGLIFKIL